jgi:protocatechuate 3,4-dioxygenase beta subunit
VVGDSGRRRVMYASDPLRPRIGISLFTDIGADPDPGVIEMRLPETRWLSGRVVDADTGRGIAGVYVRFGQQRGAESKEAAKSSVAVTDRDGTFRLPVVAGTGRVTTDDVHGYFNPSQFRQPGQPRQADEIRVDVLASGDPQPLTIKMARGLLVRGVVRDAAGKPVAGAALQAEPDAPGYRPAGAATDAEGRFQITGLSPRQAINLVALASGGEARLKVEGAPDHPLNQTRAKDVEMTLEPGVVLSGRVLHKGKPRPGVVMKLRHSLGKQSNRYIAAGETTTDAEGRYRLVGPRAGDQYMLDVGDPDGMVDPGWPYQLWVLQTIPAGRAEIDLPDVNLITRNQTLRGVVVDPQGKPVPGITISARIADKGRGSIHGPVRNFQPWPNTGADGKFEIARLPDEPIELMAYRANPKGGRILYPVNFRARLNQQDIRIVFDVTLDQPVEDLDATKDKSPPRDK